MRGIRLDDHLGHLIPPGRLARATIESGLISAMEQHRFLAGHGIPSTPTSYVVTMHPADRAWLSPDTEDEVTRALTRHAERARLLIVGEIAVRFEADATIAQGKPAFWAGFAEHDLLVLAGPKAALDVFTARA